jgi:hypothetical protein
MELPEESRVDKMIEKISRIGALSPGEVSTGGPMGSGRWLFTSDIVVMELYSDRGSLGAAVGRRGRDTYGAKVWAEVLNVSPPGDPVDCQIDFFGRHLVVLCYVVSSYGRLQRWHAPAMTTSRLCSSRSTA